MQEQTSDFESMVTHFRGGEEKMSGLDEALLTGIMLSGLTWGTLKVIIMNFREEGTKKPCDK
jgi:hypothetical protein